MIVLYPLGGLVALIALLALIAPKSYHVERSIVIKKSKDEVFGYLKFVKNQDHWSPWKAKDPNMKQEFVGEDGTVGFVSKWEGNKDVGVGEQEINKIDEGNRLDTELRFLKPWKSQSDAYIQTDEHEGGTKVSWGFTGNNPVPMNIMMLFFNFDKAVGKDFEEGLSKLKSILES